MKTICVQKGRLGSTEYFLAKIPAGELIETVGLAAEMPEWEGMTADEKMQREPDINRVVNDIVPYFIDDKDRFFGCIIVDIYSGYEDMIYEPISKIVPDLPAAYQLPLKDMGFLTLPGKERLIALDGQHRLLAIKISIRGRGAIPADLLKGRKMTEQMLALEPHPELANEEISVIFVEHRNNLKIRKIFNKVNKYARQTGRGDNIITSDDDIFALIARRLFSEGEILCSIGKNELVNWKSNTLSLRSKQLTTISALYTSAEIILKDCNFSSKSLPSEEEQEQAYEKVKAFWDESLKGLTIFKEYLKAIETNEKVSVLREKNLLMKPVTQMALAHVAYMAEQRGLSWSQIVTKLDKVDWSFENPLWFNILVIGSAKKKVITGKEAIRAAGMVISYLVMGRYMTKAEVGNVREIIRNASNNMTDELPAMIE